jgi:hypothetical protein
LLGDGGKGGGGEGKRAMKRRRQRSPRGINYLSMLKKGTRSRPRRLPRIQALFAPRARGMGPSLAPPRVGGEPCRVGPLVWAARGARRAPSTARDRTPRLRAQMFVGVWRRPHARSMPVARPADIARPVGPIPDHLPRPVRAGRPRRREKQGREGGRKRKARAINRPATQRRATIKALQCPLTRPTGAASHPRLSRAPRALPARARA